ncbi:GTP-binding protein [Schaalia hyovaginalis]|uniref:G3E family GTPase n=1 Tax=Schaalia hyovaginalis TaxID=29316 RepID=A0A923E5U2_9ACTO|nr:GTP-binding protein [Schaalia hyovaginalis]MBB6334902.1 G3E family GTPase [Schaalia hyovaginalis]
MRLSSLSSPSPMLRTAGLLAASDIAPALVVDIDEDGVSMRLIEGFEEIERREVPLAHACMSCSLREGVIPWLVELRDAGLERLILVLPVNVEALTCIPALADLTAPSQILEGVEVCTQAHLVDLAQASEDLFAHVPLEDLGLAIFEGDERCTGEVLMNGVGYADLIIALGEEGLGLDLVEHLRAFDSLMIRHLDELSPELLFDTLHDPDGAIARIHPASTEAWGGPGERGVWTLDLHSERPFHPERLASAATSLAPMGVCARGCFWLPSRPTMIGAWEVSGGRVQVGRAGEWTQDAYTHIIITGTGPDSLKDELTRAFNDLLMTPEEMAGALAFVGADDGLADWFGPEEE